MTINEDMFDYKVTMMLLNTKDYNLAKYRYHFGLGHRTEFGFSMTIDDLDKESVIVMFDMDKINNHPKGNIHLNDSEVGLVIISKGINTDRIIGFNDIVDKTKIKPFHTYTTFIKKFGSIWEKFSDEVEDNELVGLRINNDQDSL